MDDERTERLLQRYFDQVLTVEERRELEQLLLASPRSREQFWELARWNALIRQWGEAEWGRLDALAPGYPASLTDAVTRRNSNRPRLAQRVRPVAIAAAVAVACAVGYRVFRPFSPAQSPKGIAVLTRISETGGNEDGEAMQVGQALQAGWLRLSQGAVQIEFSRGARVVLEGPAELELVSAQQAFLRSGRLNAHVPKPARGFTVSTPQFTLVDRGTEFGCVVPASGPSEIHVFSGEVLWTSANGGGSGRPLQRNQAVQISNQRATSIPAQRNDFLTEDGLATLNASRERTRLAAWQESGRRLRQNESALVYLDFERGQQQERTLSNQANHAPPNSDASVIGCDPVDGRWSGKSALEFKRPDDRLRLTVPGRFRSLTLLAWVRVDTLPNRQTSLLMTESFEPGEVHWYLTSKGELTLAAYLGQPGRSRGWRRFQSPALAPENFGTWSFLATVFNGGTGEVSHYLNGEPIGNHKPGINVPLRLDTFEVGNWGVRYKDPRWPEVQWDDPDEAIRNFHGRMDEFAILATALGAQDIRRLYREGRPGETIVARIEHPSAR